MRSRRERADWNYVIDDLEKLQKKWEAKKADLVEHGRGLWAHGVVFGIETGRCKLAEEKPSSLAELEALLNKWESIGSRKSIGPTAKSIKGIDFGVRLVIGRVRRYLNRLV